MLLMKAIVKLFKPEFFYHTGNKAVTFFSIDMFKLEMSLLPDDMKAMIPSGRSHSLLYRNKLYIYRCIKESFLYYIL